MMAAMLSNLRAQSIIDDGFERILGVRAKLDHLRSYDYPSSAAGHLLTLLGLIVDALEIQLAHSGRQLLALSQTSASDAVYVALIDSVQAYTQIVSHLYPCIEYLEGAKPARNLPGIVMALERLGREVCPAADNTVFFVSSVPLGSYSFCALSEFFEDCIPFEYVLQGLPPIILLSFPEIARDQLLCHSALAHELGHFLSHKLGIYNEVGAPAEWPEAPNSLDPAQVRKHFQEYVADIVAAHLFGPAILFALAQVSEIDQGGLRKSSKHHPSPIFRIHHLCRVLEDLGLWAAFAEGQADCAQKTLQVLKAWKELADSEHDAPMAPVDRREYDVLRPALTGAHELVKKRIPESLRPRIPDALSLADDVLKLGVPPTVLSNSDEPASVGTILNAGWVFRIAHITDGPITPENLAEPTRLWKLRDLSRLINKAIEQAEVLRWKHKRREGQT
jgi:hypothetical protein